MYQEIYGRLIEKANEILQVASLLEKQKNLIAQMQKEKSLQLNGGLIYRIKKITESYWKVTVEKEEEEK